MVTKHKSGKKPTKPLRELRKLWDELKTSLARAAKSDIRYLAYSANALMTAATVERFLGGHQRFSVGHLEVAKVLWNRLWLTGMLPIVMVDDIVRGTIGLFVGHGPFIENLSAILQRDEDVSKDEETGEWQVSAWTRAYLILLFSILPIIAAESVGPVLGGLGAVVQGFGQIVPG